MSYRTYAPNITLQRLRITSANDRDQLFMPTPVTDYTPLSADSLQDAYEQHSISDYGNLTAPHSFAVTGHDAKRVRQRRRSSTAKLPKAIHLPSNEQNVTSDSQGLKAERQPQEPGEREATPGDSSALGASARSPTRTDEPQRTSSVMLTGRPVYASDNDAVEDDDHESAVILKAKWVGLSRATPYTVRLPLNTTEKVNNFSH